MKISKQKLMHERTIRETMEKINQLFPTTLDQESTACQKWYTVQYQQYQIKIVFDSNHRSPTYSFSTSKGQIYSRMFFPDMVPSIRNAKETSYQSIEEIEEKVRVLLEKTISIVEPTYQKLLAAKEKRKEEKEEIEEKKKRLREIFAERRVILLTDLTLDEIELLRASR